MVKYFEEIEDTRQQWKIKYLLVEVTFQRIFAIIKPEQLEKCFRNWVQSVFTMEKNEIICSSAS